MKVMVINMKNNCPDCMKCGQRNDEYCRNCNWLIKWKDQIEEKNITKLAQKLYHSSDLGEDIDHVIFENIFEAAYISGKNREGRTNGLE